MSEPNTIAETLRRGALRLKESGVPNDLLDAQTLLAFALERDRTWLIVNYREPLDPEQEQLFRALIERRALGEPLQYITGQQEFFGLNFEVNRAVLIPRPESELIVEETIRLVGTSDWNEPLIVDVGTGSGCLAIAIARELPAARVVAIDISDAALEVAKRNTALNGMEGRIEFVVGDLLGPFQDQACVIVSNPPYVTREEMDDLQREVRDWEPRSALTDEADGLSLHRRLIREAVDHLRWDGYLICEIGYRHAEAARDLFVAPDSSPWEPPRFLTDLQGIERTLVARLRPPSPDRG